MSRSTLLRTNVAWGTLAAQTTTTGTWARSNPSPDVLRLDCTGTGNTAWSDALSILATRDKSTSLDKVAVPEGAQIGAGVEFRWGPIGRAHSLRLGVQRYLADGSSAGAMAVVSLGGSPPAFAEWATGLWLYTVPTGTASVVVRFQTVSVTGTDPIGWQAGDWMEFRRLHVVVNPGTDYTYFGGDSPTKGNRMYSWVGVPYQSLSQEMGVLPDALSYYRATVGQTRGVAL